MGWFPSSIDERQGDDEADDGPDLAVGENQGSGRRAQVGRRCWMPPARQCSQCSEVSEVSEGGGGEGLGRKSLCTKKGPTRFSLLQISSFLTMVTWVGGAGGGGVCTRTGHSPGAQDPVSLRLPPPTPGMMQKLNVECYPLNTPRQKAAERAPGCRGYSGYRIRKEWNECLEDVTGIVYRGFIADD